MMFNIYGYLLGLANIYTFNDLREHPNFGCWLVDDLPNTPWIICGDSNMVEGQEDKQWVFPSFLLIG
jgi:hypothetical protein